MMIRSISCVLSTVRLQFAPQLGITGRYAVKQHLMSTGRSLLIGMSRISHAAVRGCHPSPTVFHRGEELVGECVYSSARRSAAVRSGDYNGIMFCR